MVRRLGLILICAGAVTGSALAAADRNPRDPQRHHNAADQAWAERIRVQRSDLGAGDWRVEPSGNDTSLGGCKAPDMSDLVETGRAPDPNFSRNLSFVGSEGEVWATTRDAVASWNRSVTFPWRTCLARELKQGLGSDGRMTLTIFANGPLRISKLAPRTFAYRLRFRIKGAAESIDGRISLYAFGNGRADVSLLVMSFGRPATPISETLERRLAAIVAKRLQR